jgi:DNA-binding NtrC family response regulator
MAQELRKKHKVLVVDDDDLVLDYIRTNLEGKDIEVFTAGSVEEGLKAVNTLPLSLVVLDWVFRVMGRRENEAKDSPAAAILDACLKKDPLFPVIVISGNQAIESASAAFAKGAAAFISKDPTLRAGPLVANVYSLLHKYEIILEQYEIAASRFRANSIEDIRPLDEIEREYVQSVVELVGSLDAAGDRLGRVRQTLAAIIKSQ